SFISAILSPPPTSPPPSSAPRPANTFTRDSASSNATTSSAPTPSSCRSPLSTPAGAPTSASSTISSQLRHPLLPRLPHELYFTGPSIGNVSTFSTCSRVCQIPRAYRYQN
ncbi:hypothetical protein LINPERPRIM_LOCUS2578, partial [Linum perenne]